MKDNRNGLKDIKQLLKSLWNFVKKQFRYRKIDLQLFINKFLYLIMLWFGINYFLVF